MAPPPFDLKWKLDECSDYGDRMRVSGWCFASGPGIARVDVCFHPVDAPIPLLSFGLPSPDVATAVDPRAERARFADWISINETQRGRDFRLRFILGDGTTHESESAHENARAGDPAHALWSRYLQMISTIPAGRVLELGSRARSGITRRHLIPAHLEYIGADILAGTNVDVVADAHELSSSFPRGHFHAVFALSVFEHLAMPWKVVLEPNAILAHGPWFLYKPRRRIRCITSPEISGDSPNIAGPRCSTS